MHRHVCITWCCKVTGVSVIYQRLRQEILLQWCCTSFKHFTVKALKCSRSSPSAHQALFVKWCLSKASQGQIWTTWEVMITFMKPKCFTSEDIFHCCCQCLECCQSVSGRKDTLDCLIQFCLVSLNWIWIKDTFSNLKAIGEKKTFTLGTKRYITRPQRGYGTQTDSPDLQNARRGVSLHLQETLKFHLFLSVVCWRTE